MAFLKLALAYCRSTAKNIYFFRVELYIRYFLKYCLFYILYAMYIQGKVCEIKSYPHKGPRRQCNLLNSESLEAGGTGMGRLLRICQGKLQSFVWFKSLLRRANVT